ncbi:MAG: DNA-formamidopyrimidine glycosylase family protein [Pseudomonadota bacterium]
MPEGHTIHRAALDQRPMLEGKLVSVSSPQGRFSRGAELINGRMCTGVEALGKHLMYHFENGLSVHIHLGLAGLIRRGPKGDEPPRDVVRVRFATENHAVDISGPAICTLLEADDRDELRKRIGPDVLSSKPDPTRAILRIRKSKAAIGTLLMNQAVISGIGNIYRVEVLWLLGIDPKTPGAALSEDQVMAIWKEVRRLMKYGVKHDAIITKRSRSKGKARYDSTVNIYGEETCPRCASDIVQEKMAARTVYFCPTCQT